MYEVSRSKRSAMLTNCRRSVRSLRHQHYTVWSSIPVCQ